MKTLSSGWQAAVLLPSITPAWAITFTRRDAVTLRFAQGRESVTIGGNAYLPAPGFDVSNITCTEGIEVDTAEITVLTSSDFLLADFMSGRWRGCRVNFDQFNRKALADGFIPWPMYRVADVVPIIGGFKLELRDARQLWRQDFTIESSKTCRHRLGGPGCLKDLTAFTHTFTLTGVTSRIQITASGLAQAADYFSNGLIIFDDGLYAGLELLISSHATGGVINLAEALYEDAVVGQTGTIIAGCLKRRDEDCVAKFDNVLNNGALGVDSPPLSHYAGQDA